MNHGTNDGFEATKSVKYWPLQNWQIKCAVKLRRREQPRKLWQPKKQKRLNHQKKRFPKFQQMLKLAALNITKNSLNKNNQMYPYNVSFKNCMIHIFFIENSTFHDSIQLYHWKSSINCTMRSFISNKITDFRAKVVRIYFYRCRKLSIIK